uniref:Uncharacterized protein n=1 Tax=Arundo donax TaxID=35708 RepID=A0A0A9BPV0_ARUDO
MGELHGRDHLSSRRLQLGEEQFLMHLEFTNDASPKVLILQISRSPSLQSSELQFGLCFETYQVRVERCCATTGIAYTEPGRSL